MWRLLRHARRRLRRLSIAQSTCVKSYSCLLSVAPAATAKPRWEDKQSYRVEDRAENCLFNHDEDYCEFKNVIHVAKHTHTHKDKISYVLAVRIYLLYAKFNKT